MEAMLKDKQLLVSDLQKEAMKLEDALQSAKRISSHRKIQLTQLHKCFLQVREYTERLKSSEHELETLVSSAMAESDDKRFESVASAMVRITCYSQHVERIK